MFTIGDFARHGRVSVRMLRHYDAIGLLRPAHVDPYSGYRFYEAAQLTGIGYRSAGYARELYLETPEDRTQWVTEIQEPVVRTP